MNFDLKKARYQKNIIKELIEKGYIEKAKEKLSEYEKDFSFDIDICSFKATILILNKNFEEAKKILLSGLKVNQFNSNILFNLGFVYNNLGDIQNSYNYYYKALLSNESEEDKKEIEEILKCLESKSFILDKSIKEKVNLKLFPLKTKDTLEIFENILNDDNKGYFSLIYNENIPNINPKIWNLMKTETLYGEKLRNIDREIIFDEDVVLPLGINKKNTRIEITYKNKKNILNTLWENRYIYLKVDKKEPFCIKTFDKIILGKPLPLEQKKETKNKMVLMLFIDGFAQEILNLYNFEDIMPNTYKFFKDGSIFNNCNINGEWTLPSVPSIFSGKYTTNHKVFHPEFPNRIGEIYPIISEFFQKEGYMTFQICGDWRKTPSYGYCKGFDRTIYQSATLGSEAKDIIFNFLEHMRSFPKRNHFAWLSFFELHKINDNYLTDISSQLESDISTYNIQESIKKSVFKSHDTSKISKYLSEIKRLDFYLKLIYDFVEENYNNDYLVTILSDHGQSFIVDDSEKNKCIYEDKKNPLSSSKATVPFFIKGKSVPKQKTNELIENADIFPTILDLNGIKYDINKIDGKTIKSICGKEEKDYVYGESLYPNQTYKARIKDHENEFFFETKNKVRNDGGINIDEYDYILKDHASNKLNSEELYNKEIINKFLNIVFDHIKEFLII